MFRIHLLGALGLSTPAGDEISAVMQQSKRFALLAWLAFGHPAAFCRRDRLLALFWPELDTDRARNALRQSLHFLRQQLGSQVLVNRGDEEIGLAAGTIWCDALAFEEALDQHRYAEALDTLYRGDFLPGLYLADAPDFERWAESERARLRDRAVAAAWAMSDDARIDRAAALDWAHRAVALAPNDEAGVRRLMIRLTERGDRAGALAAYEAMARHLEADLGLEPSPETREYADQVRSSSPPSSLTPRPSQPIVGRSDEDSNPPGAIAAGAVPAADTVHSSAADVAGPPALAVRGPRAIARVFAAAVLLAAGVALVRLLAPSPSSQLEPNLVAVAPFDVLDPGLDLWHAGMATVLAGNLDGAGPLRSVPPETVIRQWAGPTSRSTLGALAKRTGAGVVLGGRLSRIGPDSVRLVAMIGDGATGGAPVELDLRGAESRIDQLADSVTVRVLRELGRTRPIGAVRRVSIGYRSLPALKQFLRGEQRYRATDWDSALTLYRSALAEDSTFALALRRVAVMMSWIGTVLNDSARAYRLRAGQFNHGLSRRDSLSILADSLGSALEGMTPTLEWWQRRARLHTTLDEGRTLYPDDPEMWNAYGEALFHHGGHPATRTEEILRAFDRAIALDSAFAPAYIHPVAVAAARGELDRARRYAAGYRRYARAGVTATGIAWFLEATGSSAAVWPDRLTKIERPEPGALFEAWSPLNEYPETSEAALELMRRLAAGTWSVPPFSNPEFKRRFLRKTLLRQGRLREAAALTDPEDAAEFGELALVGVVPPSRAEAVFDQGLERGKPDGRFLLPWLAQRRDSGRLVRFLRKWTAQPWSADPAAASHRALGGAYLALARGDSGAAIDGLAAVPDSLCPLCVFSRLTRAELLLASDRNAEAAPMLETELAWITEAPGLGGTRWELLRAIAADRRGDVDLGAKLRLSVGARWRRAVRR